MSADGTKSVIDGDSRRKSRELTQSKVLIRAPDDFGGRESCELDAAKGRERSDRRDGGDGRETRLTESICP